MYPEHGLQVTVTFRFRWATTKKDTGDPGELKEATKQAEPVSLFHNSREQLAAELRRIELRLSRRVIELQRHRDAAFPDEFQGLSISEREIEAITGIGFQPAHHDKDPRLEAEAARITTSLKQLEREISGKKQGSAERGIRLRLDEAIRRFRLSGFDVDVLLTCLLAETNIGYQKLYAYLQNDITKKSPTINLMLETCGADYGDDSRARESFLPGAPLMKYSLVHLYEDPTSRPSPWLSSSIQIDGRIRNYLLENDQIAPDLLPFTRIRRPELAFTDIIMSHETSEFLMMLASRYRHEAPVCHFYGETGAGKKATAEAVCSELGTTILYVDCDRMISSGIATEKLLALIFREGHLQDAAIYFDGYEALLSEGSPVSGLENLETQTKYYPNWVFIAGQQPWHPKGLWQDKPYVNLELPVPSFELRRLLWDKYRNGAAVADNIDFDDVAGKFRFTGGQIRSVTAKTGNLARVRQPDNPVITREDLYSCCRNESKEILNDLARKVHPKYGWDDIILPRDQTEQLHEICNYVQHYYRVYSDWGFDKKLSLGKGLNVLFSGPSGTGKTMAAEILANELQLEIYKIDLSTVVSKYIGETEKNLDRIFKEGRTSNAILFFDEADAVFGKRSEVKDAHDRYANIETAYLLMKMDDYDGIVILATNLRKNMDEAFSRRMHFTLEFPIPEEADRERIWRSVFPAEAPLADETDFPFLARQFRITGGNIKNIALGAAFLAARNGNRIEMPHIIRAIRREYQKIGKLCTEEEFAGYFELLKT